MSDPLLQRRPPPPIPFTVLTGFLAAAQDDAAQSPARHPGLSDAPILINEFGEIGLDHLLVEKVDDDMLLMCGLPVLHDKGRLIATLEDALRNRDNGRIKPFSRVIVETTGLADPAPVLHTIMHHPYLMLRFRLQGVVTVVDAINGSAYSTRRKRLRSRSRSPTASWLTETDLAHASDEDAVEHFRRDQALAPAARIIEIADARTENLLDAGLFGSRGIPDVERSAERRGARRSQAGPSRTDMITIITIIIPTVGTHDDHADRDDPNRHDARSAPSA